METLKQLYELIAAHPWITLLLLYCVGHLIANLLNWLLILIATLTHKDGNLNITMDDSLVSLNKKEDNKELDNNEEQ